MHLLLYLVDGVEGNKGPQLRIIVQVPDDLLERTEPAEGFEVRQRDGHLGLVVVVRVHVGTLSVELLGELFIRVRLLVVNTESLRNKNDGVLL